MDTIPYEKLEQMFKEAYKIVPPATRWRHYKGVECTAWRLAVIEATQELAVVYSAIEYPDISFICPLKTWNQQVESGDGVVPRFQRIWVSAE